MTAEDVDLDSSIASDKLALTPHQQPLRPILDAVLRQGVLRLFQHGLVRLGTPLF